MTDNENKNNEVCIDSFLELDTKLLSSAIIELNISRKNILLYPFDHPIIEKATSKAYKLLQEIFGMRSEITLGVSKNTLIIEQNYLDPRNPIYQDFARAMFSKMIAAVIFINGVSIEELNQFLLTVSSSDDEIASKGGITKMLAQNQVHHVSVALIDYDAFHLTSEEEILKKDKTADATSGTLWDSFVYNLMGNSLDVHSDASDETQKKEMIKVNPRMLAKMISESKYRHNSGNGKYDETITDYLQEVSRKDTLSNTQKKAYIKDIAGFTNELTPEIRRELLSSTLKSQSVKLENMEDFVSDLSNEVIMDALQEVSSEKLVIPTTILNLLEKFSGLKSDSMPLKHSRKKKDEVPPDELKQNLKRLMSGDHQQEYTPSVYQSSLDQLGDKECAARFKENFPDEVSRTAKTFSGESINIKYTSTLIIIAKYEKNDDDLKRIIERIFEDSLFFIETGQYEPALIAWSFFMSIIESDNFSEECKEDIWDKIDDVKELKIPDELIDGLKEWGKEKFEVIKDLLLIFQDISIKPLLKGLSIEKTAHSRRTYIDVISRMDKRVSAYLVKHLNDNKWYFVRNMITLLRNLRAEEFMEEIKKCYNHEHHTVKLEVIKTVLSFNDHDAVDFLKRGMASDNEDFSHSCMILAGAYKVTELTLFLLDKLKKHKSVFFDSDIKERKITLQALGKMGDSRAIPSFKEILTDKSFFLQRKHKELKLEVLNNLSQFKCEDIKELIDVCKKIKDEDIQKSCKKYL